MKKTDVIMASLLMVSVAANVWLWKIANKHAVVKVETHTEYVTIRDTVPVLVESHLTGETIVVTVRPEANASGTTAVADASGTTAAHHHATNHEPDKPEMELTPDTIVTVSIVGDSATVTLPVEQRVYQDSLYTAYVSGYHPKLDSITLRLPHTYKTVTTTMSKPLRRWAIGPAVGAGYGITGRQLDVFVGVSVMWNILK